MTANQSRRPSLGLALLIAALIYCGGYVYCRVTHRIIHRQGYGGHTVATHSVEGYLGDGDPRYAAAFEVLDLALTPLRYLELGWWHLVRPIGQPWPHHPPPR